MTEPAGPQLVPTSSYRSGATVVFGLTALVWTLWLGAIASALSVLLPAPERPVRRAIAFLQCRA